MIDDHLAVPFETAVLGVQVAVERIDLSRSEQIVAICKRGQQRQALRKHIALKDALADREPDGDVQVATRALWPGSESWAPQLVSRQQDSRAGLAAR